jgi:hypothetical protein
MGAFGQLIAGLLLVGFSFFFGLLQRRPARSAGLRFPRRIGDAPRTELHAETRL